MLHIHNIYKKKIKTKNGSSQWNQKWFFSMEPKMVLLNGTKNGSSQWNQKWFFSMEPKMVLLIYGIAVKNLLSTFIFKSV